MRLCEKHQLEKIYFCKERSCQKPLCPECFILSHIGHKKVMVRDQITECKRKIESAILPLDAKIG